MVLLVAVDPKGVIDDNGSVAAEDNEAAFDIIPRAEATLLEPLLPTHSEAPSLSLEQTDDCTTASAPQAEAVLLPQDVNNSFSSSPLYDFDTDVVCAEPVGYARPELIFCRATKPCPNHPVGLFLKSKAAGTERRRKNVVEYVYISRIRKDTMFDKSNLRPGDRVVSINNVSCVGKTATEVGKLIKRIRTTVSIIVHHAEGNPGLASCSFMMNNSSNRKIGVTFANSRDSALYISRVDPRGLCRHSFLAPGYRCLQINGVYTNQLVSSEAAEMVAATSLNHYVTLVVQPRKEFAMVLSCCEVKKVWAAGAALGFLGVAATAAAFGASQVLS